MGDSKPGESMPSMEALVGAWLSSDSPEEAATLQQQRTIEPEHHSADTAGRRAIAALQQVLQGTARVKAVQTLGQGGMGVVRLAEQVALGRMVAVKTLRPDRPGEGPALDLLREAWVTGMLEHPNVVPVYDIGLDDDGRPMIVLKRIEGHSWFELIDDPARVKELFGAEDMLAWNLEILMQVLHALRFAHSRGIVHRDLKPDNVMLGEFGEVYLLDWGIAVSLRDDGSGRLPLAADAIELAGTPCYMAPEMLGSDSGLALSEKTDIYLAGAVLYEIIAGHPPHEGETAHAVVASVVRSDPEFPEDAPAELIKICRRAMDADPHGRFENAEQLRLALRGFLQRRGSARLAEAAERRLASLIAAVASPDAKDPARRQELYDLFGAARFGFHEALAGWRDNPVAHDGLRRAVEAMIGYELGTGDARAASVLLAQISQPPPALVTRVAEAVAIARERQAKLERLEESLDVRIGTRTRTFGSFLMGAFFTLFPLIAAISGNNMSLRSYSVMVGWTLAYLAGVVAFGVWARQSMMRTLFNRRIWATTQLVFVGQLVLYVGTWQLGISPVVANVMMIFLWFAIAAMAAITLDLRLWPTAAGYALAFVAAARWPEHRHWAMAASNFVLTINAVWIWRPERMQMTDAERIEFGRPLRRKRSAP